MFPFKHYMSGNDWSTTVVAPVDMDNHQTEAHRDTRYATPSSIINQCHPLFLFRVSSVMLGEGSVQVQVCGEE